MAGIDPCATTVAEAGRTARQAEESKGPRSITRLLENSRLSRVDPEPFSFDYGFTALSTARPAFSPGPGLVTASLASRMPLSTASPALWAGPFSASQPVNAKTTPNIRAARGERKFIGRLFNGNSLESG
jgi:hypothetical protein